MGYSSISTKLLHTQLLLFTCWAATALASSTWRVCLRASKTQVSELFCSCYFTICFCCVATSLTSICHILAGKHVCMHKPLYYTLTRNLYSHTDFSHFTIQRLSPVSLQSLTSNIRLLIMFPLQHCLAACLLHFSVNFAYHILSHLFFFFFNMLINSFFFVFHCLCRLNCFFFS